jgi:hypothetical protein
MLKWLSNLDNTERAGNFLVKSMVMEEDFKLLIYYDLELYRIGKTGLTTLKLIYTNEERAEKVVLESEVLSGKVLNARLHNVLITSQVYSENTLLNAIENFNMILRYLIVETQNKGDQQ